jgi:hypothetical protein
MKGFFSTLAGWFVDTFAAQSYENDQLEGFLTRQLAPVAPRPSYVDTLGKQLSDRSQQVLVQEPSRALASREKAIWIAAGVIGGILLFLYLKRIIKFSGASPRN